MAAMFNFSSRPKGFLHKFIFFTIETSLLKRSGESMCWINISATQVMNRGRPAADARGVGMIGGILGAQQLQLQS